MRGIVIITIVLTAGCSSAGEAESIHQHPNWMVGSWVDLDKSTRRSADMCNNDHTIYYDADGTYTFGDIDEEGRWWIQGNRLVEVVTRPADGDLPGTEGRRTIQTFKRVAADELQFMVEGQTVSLVRCPEDAK